MDEARGFLEHAVALRGEAADAAPQIMAAFITQQPASAVKIDPSVLPHRPAQMIDGDVTYWVGGIFALLGEREKALAWLRRADELANHNYPWFESDKNWNKLRSDPEYQRIMADIKSHQEKYRAEFGGG